MGKRPATRSAYRCPNCRSASRADVAMRPDVPFEFVGAERLQADGAAICYISPRNSRGARPVAFRKARAKLAGEEYPISAETRVIEPSVCRSNSVAR